MMAAATIDWQDSAKKRFVVNPVGLAKVVVTGTHTWDDIYQDASLKEIYIFKRTDSESRLGYKTGGGFYDAYIDLFIGDDSTATTLTMNNCTIRLWGRLMQGPIGGGGDNSTLTMGSKSTNSRINGCHIIRMGWTGMQELHSPNPIWNMYDCEIAEVTYSIDADFLEDSDVDATGILYLTGHGKDGNFHFAGRGTWESVKFKDLGRFRQNQKSGETYSLDSAAPVTVHGVENFDLFYTNSAGKYQHDGWIVENSSYGMFGTGNPQTSENGYDFVFKDFTVRDASTAEARIDTANNFNIFSPNIVGGTASNTDFKLELGTNQWNTAYAYQRDIRLWFGLAVKVLDLADGSNIASAAVKVYINYPATTTLAKTTDTTASTITLSDWDKTTDANGEIAEVPLLWAIWESKLTSGAGNIVDTLSGHVSNNRLNTTAYHPFTVKVTKTGYRDVIVPLEMDETKRLVVAMEPHTGPRQLVRLDKNLAVDTSGDLHVVL